tara:strand:- start:278 stop:487 length:210 start_codon:yes stop_codon:yes gene_type:complete
MDSPIAPNTPEINDSAYNSPYDSAYESDEESQMLQLHNERMALQRQELDKLISKIETLKKLLDSESINE